MYLSGPALDRTVVVGVVDFEHFLEEEGAQEVRGFAILRVMGHPRAVALLQEPHVHVDGLNWTCAILDMYLWPLVQSL